MQIPPLPANEAQRLSRLHGLNILDTLPQKAFDDISALAQLICGTPVAMITLIDQNRQWFKSRIGIEAQEIPRELAFCSHAILDPDHVMVVEDLSQDARFNDNPFVAGPPDIRFYAGAPIVTHDGFALGTVCVIDSKVRTLEAGQLDALRRLASLVISLLEHESVRIEEATRNSETWRLQLEELTAMAIAGLDLQVYIDPHYLIQHVNDTYLAYWGGTREDIVGRHIAERVGDDVFRTIIQPKLDRALAGESVSYTRKTDFPARGSRHVEVALLPVRNARGEITGAVMRAQDVQETRTREAQLQQTVALLEQRTMEQERFIHIISHDLREPINTVNNFTSLLVTDHQDELSPSAQRYLSFVQSGGQRMSFLLDDLLHFVRLDNRTVQLRPVEVSRLMQQIEVDLAPTISRMEGRLDCHPQPQVMADESLLRIVLKNLASNGLKFARRGVPPVVRISVEVVEGGHLIHVSDNGIGIAEDHQRDIFDMFKRLHTRKHYEGSGLGLSICRRIAQLHGGRMSVQSVPGEGSRFTLHLPAAPAAPHLE
ncbi:MAG: ATP-binding protein [Hydrogenophaga sp.]|uniref:sensor histidine kinase n=1 Tax=Hydrogenophaga sp. TaxID=1904254 RepID=UPI002ABA2804|nr:ATP-binding protein [Hydrogenophaga sp.]MDZ4101279.1 ATP-binding protein [Hydrogenophaga sp.]